MKKILTILLVLIIVIALIMAGIYFARNYFHTGSSSPTRNSATVSKINYPKTQYFDVPVLVGHSIDEIENAIGKPIDQGPMKKQLSSIKQNPPTWVHIFRNGKYEMDVTYNVKSKKATSFFIPSDDPSGVTKDREHLLKLGNVQENNPHYGVVFVKSADDPTEFTGISIFPR